MADLNVPKIKRELEKRTKKKVAQHTIRLDKEGPTGNTHGWQARWMPKSEQRTKLFSDILNQLETCLEDMGKKVTIDVQIMFLNLEAIFVAY